MAEAPVTLYYAPHTRATGVLGLLEELGAPPVALHVLDMGRGEQREPAYLAVNPLGKVPALRDGDALVTEQGAVYLHLAERFPDAGLAPALGDPLRGPFLRWLFLYGSSFEPAVVDRALKREPGNPGMSPYGDFDAVLRTVEAGLSPGPWLLGERFSAADALWGAALGWTTRFGVVPRSPVIGAYVDRFEARPAIRRAQAREQAILEARAGGQG